MLGPWSQIENFGQFSMSKRKFFWQSMLRVAALEVFAKTSGWLIYTIVVGGDGKRYIGTKVNRPIDDGSLKAGRRTERHESQPHLAPNFLPILFLYLIYIYIYIYICFYLYTHKKKCVPHCTTIFNIPKTLSPSVHTGPEPNIPSGYLT